MRMHCSQILRSTVTCLLLLAAGHTSAQAQPLGGGPVDLQLFRPAMDSKGFITQDASQVLGHLDVSFGLVLNYARRPLSLASTLTAADLRSQYEVRNLATGNLQAAVGLFKHLELGIGLPLTLWNGDTDPDTDPDDAAGDIDAQGVGDLSIHLKGRILNTSRYPVGLALVTTLSVPTGDDEKFLGSGRVGLNPKLIIDKELLDGRLKLAFNIGARFRFGSSDGFTDLRQCSINDLLQACGTGRSIETGQQLIYGFGVAFGIVPQRFDLVAEIYGQTGFEGLYELDKRNSAHEIVAGAKLYLARNSYLLLGAGRGLRGGGDNFQYGSPDVRGFLGFIFEPSIGDIDGDGIKDDIDKCPTEPEDFDDFEDEDGCPDPDNDKDGIPDTDDKCPNEPEDRDGVQDEDGCPEPDMFDRDGDGIPDDKDKCPDDPEDMDGFEDEDGCPDPDNDKDGILDDDDLCPNDPEDKDGFEDTDGCPDPDNDKDRILDVDDKCPNEPETYNGLDDEDGCPDKGRVIVHKGRIEILDKIYFETAKAVIKPVSYPILDAIAATLRGNPGITLVEIQGHADERGSASYNQDLTERRAAAVRRYLTDADVEASRLKAKGYGESKPVDPGHNEAAWSKNRRVEFVILKRAD
jgi:OOP family OmpA-OmpF porin